MIAFRVDDGFLSTFFTLTVNMFMISTGIKTHKPLRIFQH